MNEEACEGPSRGPSRKEARMSNDEGEEKTGWARRHGPTVLVLAVLGGVAYGGHRTGWKAPHLSQVFGGASGPYRRIP